MYTAAMIYPLWLVTLLAPASFANPLALPADDKPALANSSETNNQDCVVGKPCTKVESMAGPINWGNAHPWHVILQLKDHPASPCVAEDGKEFELACDGTDMKMPTTLTETESNGVVKTVPGTLTVTIQEDEGVANTQLRDKIVEMMSGLFNIGEQNQPVQLKKLKEVKCTSFRCGQPNGVENDGDPFPQNHAGSKYTIAGQDERGEKYKMIIGVKSDGPPPPGGPGANNCPAITTATAGVGTILGIIGIWFPPAAVAAAALGFGGALCGIVASDKGKAGG